MESPPTLMGSSPNLVFFPTANFMLLLGVDNGNGVYGEISRPTILARVFYNGAGNFWKKPNESTGLPYMYRTELDSLVRTRGPLGLYRRQRAVPTQNPSLYRRQTKQLDT